MSGNINLDKEFETEFAKMSDFKREKLYELARKENGKKGGEATKKKFGSDYYKNIRKMVGKTASKNI